MRWRCGGGTVGCVGVQWGAVGCGGVRWGAVGCGEVRWGCGCGAVGVGCGALGLRWGCGRGAVGVRVRCAGVRLGHRGVQWGCGWGTGGGDAVWVWWRWILLYYFRLIIAKTILQCCLFNGGRGWGNVAPYQISGEETFVREAQKDIQ